MAIHIDVNETREYILKQDLELSSEKQTIFHLGVLDARLARHLKDSVVSFAVNDKGPDAQASVVLNRATLQLQIVRFGLKSWSNLLNKSGSPVPFNPEIHQKSFPIPKCGNRTGLTDAAIDMLKPFLSELAREIESDNWMDEAEEKNSESPSA